MGLAAKLKPQLTRRQYISIAKGESVRTFGEEEEWAGRCPLTRQKAFLML